MNQSSSVIPDRPTDNFSISRWIELVEPLRDCEFLLRECAARHGLQLRGSSRWPEVNLRLSRGLLVLDVRVSMVADPGPGKRPEWTVELVRYPRFPPLLSGAGDSEQVAIISADDLTPSSGRFAEAVEDAVRRLIVSTGRAKS